MPLSSHPLLHPPLGTHTDAESSEVRGVYRSDRYQNPRSLATGAMGRIALCHDPRTGRSVAVKSMRADVQVTQVERERFMREARIQAQLEHPCIAPVYDIEDERERSPRFTMRYVRGETLAQVIAGLARNDPSFVERYSRRKLLTAFSAVCNAVHYAHTRGVIHRDLKPENVMFGEFGEVYVLDWGVANSTPAAVAPVDAPLPRGCEAERGALVGTPGFIAPEQWLNEVELDARADVYSLGALLFELITLTPMHDGSNTREIMAQTFRGEVVAPSVRAPERNIPPELDRLCLTATARSRDERYASARELHDEVERFLDGDRDHALRVEASATLAAEAEALACSALSPNGAPGERAQALARVGRSLALDPSNTQALRVLLRLLLEPPTEVPSEVALGLERDWTRRVRTVTRVGLWASISWVALVPLMLWAGVRDYGFLAAIGAAIALCAGLARYHAVRSTTHLAAYATLVASTFAIASLGAVFGPLLVVPSALVAVALLFAVHGDRLSRGVVVLTSMAAFLAPLGLERIGVLPRSFSFEHGRLVIDTHLTELQHTWALVVFLCVHFAILTSSVWAIALARASSARETVRLRVLAWQLRQIVPEGARDALTHATSTAVQPLREG